MMKRLLLALIVAVGLGGCAGLTQFPMVTKDYNQALRDLDADYATTVNRIYGSDSIEGTGMGMTPSTEPTKSAFVQPSAEEQKNIRRAMMERRMAVIDAYFKEFQAGLVRENVRTEFGIDLLSVGVGASGALVSETASQILSAVSGGLAGARAAYGKAALYEKTMSALVAQMLAGRKAVAAQIFQRWDLDLNQYPMWMARTDLDAYYFAGSLPGAILGTAADANVKETQADKQIEIVRSADFTKNSELAKAIGDRLKSLTPTQALALAKAMELHIAKRSQKQKDILKALDPKDERLTDGNKAKQVLLTWQDFDDRDTTSMKQWTDVLDVVEHL